MYHGEINVENELEQEISLYRQEKRLKASEECIQFWLHKENTYKKLYKVMKILSGVPLIEVSVKRLFSNVKFILNCLRTRTLKEHLEDTMFLHSNFKYIEQILKNVT